MGNHIGVASILLVAAAFSLVMGILLSISQSRVRGSSDFETNDKLQSAESWIITAYVLAYIAAGITIVLSILYFGHVTWGINNEWPHLVVYIILFILIVLSGIFGFIALSDLDYSNANKESADAWIWWSLGAGLVSILLILISGA